MQNFLGSHAAEIYANLVNMLTSKLWMSFKKCTSYILVLSLPTEQEVLTGHICNEILLKNSILNMMVDKCWFIQQISQEQISQIFLEKKKSEIKYYVYLVYVYFPSSKFSLKQYYTFGINIYTFQKHFQV